MKHEPNWFEEIAPSTCMSGFASKPPDKLGPLGHFQGSVFVTRRARTYMESMCTCCLGLVENLNVDDLFFTDKLYNSQYGSPDDIDHIVDCFDKSTKLAFNDPSQTAFVRFGSTRDSDSSVDIKLGQLRLRGFDSTPVPGTKTTHLHTP